ncbi:MAG: RDD family protein, partial [Chitinophagaceae bacterium]|nr:RDD family protein [Chitinophagaceae bacterium]
MEQMENLLNDFEEPKYRYVGFWPRFGALVMDGIILWVFGYLLGYVLPYNLPFLSIAVTTVIPIAYNLVLEYKFGATIGKMLLRMKIVNDTLQPPGMNNILLRNIIYIGLEMIS